MLRPPGGQWRPLGQYPAARLLEGMAVAALMTLVVACTERQGTSATAPLPVAATAYASPDGRTVPVAKDPPQDIQELRVTVAASGFDADRYHAQARATRLVVTTQGGPYTLSINGLLQPQTLQANGTTQVGLTLPDPGPYVMELSGATADTAVLDVRAAGSR